MLEGNLNLKPADIKQIRKLAVQYAYQQDINQQFIIQKNIFENFLIQSQVLENHKLFLKSLLTCLFEQIEKIDSIIVKFAKNWKITRISKVDLAVLRVSIVELMERTDTEVAIILSEAASIAQEFGSANSPAFVNGILDAIAKEVRKNKDELN